MILSIGRQLGAGGLEVGKQISERTGMRLYDGELLDEAARESGLSRDCFKRVDEQSHHGLGIGIFGMRFPFFSEGSSVNGGALSGDELFKIQSETIKKLADENRERGCIFIGRCANYVLRDDSDMRSVFLTASNEDRIKRVSRRFGCSAEEAQEMMKKIDHQRTAYFDYYASRTWGKASSYHICLNTSVLGMERCINIIIENLLQIK